MVLDDGGQYTPSPVQREMWRAWESYWRDVQAEAGTSPLYVVVGGDTVDVDAKGRSHQVITRNRATAARMAIDVLEHPASIAKGLFFVRGTEAHVGKSAAVEEALAADFINTIRPTKDMASWWHLRADLGGVKFDVRHHPTGSVKNPSALALRLRDEYLSWDEKPPAFVLMGHTHCFYDSGEITQVTPRAIGMGCWSWHGAHSYRSGYGGVRPQIGGLVITLETGRFAIKAHIFNMGRERPWTAKSGS